MKEERITNRDILGQIHNAQLFSASKIDEDRLETLLVWARALCAEAEGWVKKSVEGSEFHLDDAEVVFVLASVAYELQDRLMVRENPKCQTREESSFERWKELV